MFVNLLHTFWQQHCKQRLWIVEKFKGQGSKNSGHQVPTESNSFGLQISKQKPNIQRSNSVIKQPFARLLSGSQLWREFHLTTQFPLTVWRRTSRKSILVLGGYLILNIIKSLGWGRRIKKTEMQVNCQSLCQYISMDTSCLAWWIFSSYTPQRF